MKLIQSKALKTFSVAALMLGATNCERSKKSTPKYDIKEVTSDQASVQTTYFATFSDKPGWPPSPRRDHSWESSVFANGAITAGIKVAAFGSEASSTTKVKFETKRKTRLWILMHTPTLTEQMYDATGDGGIFLNAKEDYKMVAICMFSLHLSADASTLASLSIQGNGVSGEAGLAQESTITQMSDFFPVKMGDSVRDWFGKCDEVFEEKVRKSMESDMIAASAAMLYHVKQDQCVIPDVDKDREFSSGRAGDRSCEKFYNELFPSVSAYYTARCIRQEGLPQNVGFCQVRSPAGQSCKLYKDAEGKISETATEGSSLVTGSFSYPCDKSSGLKCVMTQEGGWFKTWTEIHRNYEGVCK